MGKFKAKVHHKKRLFYVDLTLKTAISTCLDPNLITLKVSQLSLLVVALDSRKRGLKVQQTGGRLSMAGLGKQSTVLVV